MCDKFSRVAYRLSSGSLSEKAFQRAFVRELFLYFFLSQKKAFTCFMKHFKLKMIVCPTDRKHKNINIAHHKEKFL